MNRSSTATVRSTPRGRTLLGPLVLALALVCVSCGDDGAGTPTGSPAGVAPSTPSSSGSGAAAGDVVVIDQVMFVTRELTVAAGTEVEFRNDDNQAHTATADGGSFDTGLVAAGSSARVRLDRAGTVTYHCSLHPFMTAKVVVR